MAAAVSRILIRQQAIDPEVVAFQQFFGTLASNSSVEMVGVDPKGGYLDLWIRLNADRDDHEDALYTAVSTYHASPGVATPVDIHVVFADEPPEAFPASIQVLYRRP